MTANYMLQGLILYSALTCASTPVALRYLYLQDKPPASPVLAAVQTSFAAVILVIISGPLRMRYMPWRHTWKQSLHAAMGQPTSTKPALRSRADPTRLSACLQLLRGKW